jgi:hypothetical protein
MLRILSITATKDLIVSWLRDQLRLLSRFADPLQISDTSFQIRRTRRPSMVVAERAYARRVVILNGIGAKELV